MSPPPPPPPEPPPEDFYGISFVAFVFRCGEEFFKAKYDAEAGRWEDVESRDGERGLANCDLINRWTEATPLPEPYNAPPGKGPIVVNAVVIDGEVFQVTFQLPTTCTFNDGSAVVKGGQDIDGDRGCAYPEVIDAQTFTFTARLKAA